MILFVTLVTITMYKRCILLHEFFFQAIAELMRQVPHSAKFAWVFNFTNFVNFQPVVKTFKQKFLTQRRAANLQNYFNEIFCILLHILFQAIVELTRQLC